MASLFSFLIYLLASSSFVLVAISSLSEAATSNSIDREQNDAYGSVGRLAKKEDRKVILSAEYGEISAVDIDDGTGKRSYHLQFIKLDPNTLFLPVFLHTDMIFYVHTGSGRLSWTDKDEMAQLRLERGDVFRLRAGTIFYIQSDLEPERISLRINAIFAPSDEVDLEEPIVGAYSSIHDLIRGFDKRILQAAFKVPEEVIEELVTGAKTPGIVHAVSTKKKAFWNKEVLFVRSFLRMRGHGKSDIENKKKKKKGKTRTFNFLKEDPDFENCNGWGKVLSRKDLDALEGSQITVFMVNLTKGSMMGPHWNPMATEMSVVLQGMGMVRVVCPSTLKKSECNSSRFRVKEGDIFSVPRFHPMTQISFNNDSFVFMGFSTSTKENHPQFLAGKASVLQALDRHILEASFNVANTTIDQILSAKEESIILDCTSCAEEEEMLLKKELETEREEGEARKRREEEERKRQEEEERRQEEEKRRQKEEEEEERKREEEERRQEEEKRRQKEEKEERKREEEEKEERQREEEEERRQGEEKRRQKEEERQREEEEQRKQEEEEEEEEEQRRREEEEEEQRQQEEEEEEERRRRRHEEETGEESETEKEAAARREEERAEGERKSEEERSRREERESAAELLASEGEVRMKQVTQQEQLQRDGDGSKEGEGRSLLKV